MDENRIKHSYAVANKMIEIGKQHNLKEKELEELFVLGFNHDIGYNFENNENHNIIGAEILKNSNYKYWKEVYYHGIPKCKYKSIYLDILNEADMCINKFGVDVGFTKRLIDIEERYGIDSIQYKNANMIVQELNKGGK